MKILHEIDPLHGELFLAGQRVPAGTYRQIGGGREVILTSEDWLPASLDGRVACYERVVYAAVSLAKDGNESALNHADKGVSDLVSRGGGRCMLKS